MELANNHVFGFNCDLMLVSFVNMPIDNSTKNNKTRYD
jgi:hypothetical protein